MKNLKVSGKREEAERIIASKWKPSMRVLCRTTDGLYVGTVQNVSPRNAVTVKLDNAKVITTGNNAAIIGPSVERKRVNQIDDAHMCEWLK